MIFKAYQFKKIKSHLKNNNLLIISNGINQNSNNWIKIEQGLKKLKLEYYKSYNKLTTKILKTSIFLNFNKSVNGPLFFLKPKQKSFLSNENFLLIENLKTLYFTLLAIKINNKVYSKLQIKNIITFSYKTNLVILYQFLLVNLKNSFLLKFRNNVI